MAANDQLLEQMRKVVREENEPINKHLDGIDKHLDGIDKRLDGLEEGQKRLEKKLDTEVIDLAETQREILLKLNQLEDHERRISQLEEDNMYPSH